MGPGSLQLLRQVLHVYGSFLNPEERSPPWACSGRTSVTCQPNTPCELAPSQHQLTVHPDIQSRKGAQRPMAKDLRGHPPTQGRGLPGLLSPTCLRAQKLWSQYRPSPLLFSCPALCPGQFQLLGLLHCPQVWFDGLQLLPAHSPRLSPSSSRGREEVGRPDPSDPQEHAWGFSKGNGKAMRTWGTEKPLQSSPNIARPLQRSRPDPSSLCRAGHPQDPLPGRGQRHPHYSLQGWGQL